MSKGEVFYILVKLPLEGFQRFLCSWIIRDTERGRTLLVDPGPAAGIAGLVEDMRTRGVSRLDTVLLTHIHMDHAGGIAELLAAYPEAKVICPSKAKKHLIDPTRLWESSLETLGEVARAYGQQHAISASALLADDISIPGLESYDTPGHAPFHTSYVYEMDGKRFLFPGEAAGVYFETTNGFYMRPASPPKFRMDIALASLDRIRAVPSDTICYPHYGSAPCASAMLDHAREQMLRWDQLVERYMDEGLTLEDMLPRLVDDDPLYHDIIELEADVSGRERFFSLQCLRGYVGWIESRRKEKKLLPSS